MDTNADILAEAKRNRLSALALLDQAREGGHLPLGVTMSGLEESIRDYDAIIKQLGFCDNA